ncbi:hypothetical protein NMY22_g13097 [Coprinellus aureogranulatus]|nr:hypothetical protein NMY22_g13097 [Coprinellus aureogranulatus]
MDAPVLIGSTSLGTAVDAHCLTQFNLALLICEVDERETVTLSPMLVNLWKVVVWNGSEGSELLQLADHLSSFTEVPGYGLKAASLYGSTLAYSILPNAMFIVDWRGVNGRTLDEPLSCRCIPVILPDNVKSIQLLPRNRIVLGTSGPFYTLHNWENDYVPVEVPPSDPFSAIPEAPQPIWELEPLRGDDENYKFIPQPSLIMGRTIHLVLPTSNAVYGLIIDIDDHSPEGIEEHVLSEIPIIRMSPYAQSFALNRTIGISGKDDNGLFYAEYEWEGHGARGHFDSECLFAEIPGFDLAERDSLLLAFDQFSNRVVVVDEEAKSVITVGLAFDLLCAALQLAKEEEEATMTTVGNSAADLLIGREAPLRSSEQGEIHAESDAEEGGNRGGSTTSDHDSDAGNTPKRSARQEASDNEGGTRCYPDGLSEEKSDDEAGRDSEEESEGAEDVVGYVFAKANGDHENPAVLEDDTPV